MDHHRRAYDWLATRLGLARERTMLGKAFPAEDSFLLGEVSLFTFVVLALTGIFLGAFYEPSTAKVTYDGSVAAFQGEDHPAAFVSVLQITYDVPYGMFVRRLHHWAAHLFVASTGLHMLRVFFTGAYRNPREPNWVVGTTLAVLAMGAAYTGYALPFDEFAATATGIGFTIASSIPIVGDTLAKLVFGGSFPSSATIPRLYFIHVVVLPVAIAGGIALHMAILLRQKHTEHANSGARAAWERAKATVPADADDGEGVAVDADDGEDLPADADGGEAPPADADGGAAPPADDGYVVGLPAVPNQAAVSAVVFFLTLAVLSLLAGFLPVHNVAAYGPNDPASTPALIMPDWFFMWLYGFLKVLPTWASFTVPVVGIHVSTEFLGGVVLPALVFGAVYAWPFVDRSATPTHTSLDPLSRPRQTAIGVGAVVFVMIASIAGMNNVAADAVGADAGLVTLVLTVALLVGPPVAMAVTYRTLDAGGDDDGE